MDTAKAGEQKIGLKAAEEGDLGFREAELQEVGFQIGEGVSNGQTGKN